MMRNAYETSVGKCEGKRPPGRSRHRWEDNIRLGLTEIWWDVVDWIHLAQDRQMSVSCETAMRLQVV
jgi:hypothetical protein